MSKSLKMKALISNILFYIKKEIYYTHTYCILIQALTVLAFYSSSYFCHWMCIFPFPNLGQLSNALRWSAGFGLYSYFSVRLLC